MKKIDGHMHVARWNVGEETAVDVLQRYKKENNLTAVDIMCCSNRGKLWDGYQDDQCILAAMTKFEDPSTYIHGCMIIPEETENVPEEYTFPYQLEMLRSMGFDGIKNCEYKPDSYKLHRVDDRDESYEAYFAFCEKKGIPMCWHVADPDTFWDANLVAEWAVKAGYFYGDGTYPTYEKLYEKSLAILDRHPNLTVMLAHAYFWSNEPDKVRALFDKYPNVLLDMAPGWEMFDGYRTHYEDWYRIFRQYSDRIVFATDACMDSGSDYSGRLADNVSRFLTTTDAFETPGNHQAHGIALEDEHLAKIFHGNVHRLLGDAPKPLDRNVLREYIRTYLPALPESVNTAGIKAWVKRHLG